MTNAEKALVRINNAASKLVARGSVGDKQPATHLISGCHWPEAITEINEAINELDQARALLAPLAEGRPRN